MSCDFPAPFLQIIWPQRTHLHHTDISCNEPVHDKIPASMRRNSKILPTSTKKSDASTLYLDWADAAEYEYASKNRPITSSTSADARSVCSAPKSTKSASSFLSLNLLQETAEHIASATSSSRSLGCMLRRNASDRSRQGNTSATTSSRKLKKAGSSGMLLSDLASEINSLCSASQLQDVKTTTITMMAVVMMATRASPSKISETVTISLLI